MKSFGGTHTLAKLHCLKACLQAFSSAMQESKFRLKYIDPFAGNGRWSPRYEAQTGGFFPPPPVVRFRGSARIALSFESFRKFHLGDENEGNVKALEALKTKFPSRNLALMRGKASSHLNLICNRTKWETWRGFAFLDPFGLPPDWDAIKSIAATRAIDILCLLPPGINRLLPLNGTLTETNRATVDQFCPSLYDACYRTYKSGLLERREVCVKVLTPRGLAEHYGTELRKIFKHMVRSPLPLNTQGPTYYLWGAVTDDKGAADRLARMQAIFSDPDLRWKARQAYGSAHLRKQRT